MTDETTLLPFGPSLLASRLVLLPLLFARDVAALHSRGVERCCLAEPQPRPGPSSPTSARRPAARFPSSSSASSSTTTLASYTVTAVTPPPMASRRAVGPKEPAHAGTDAAQLDSPAWRPPGPSAGSPTNTPGLRAWPQVIHSRARVCVWRAACMIPRIACLLLIL